MRIRRDITGQRFGRLVVIGRVVGDRWGVECDCGAQKIVQRANLTSGHTRSCGCLMRETSATVNASHGARRRGIDKGGYHSWTGMVQRCTNPKSPQWQYYGGRGITVCDHWRDYAAFLADMGPRPSKDHTIERMDGDGQYEPSNCEWATRTTQGRNRRCVRLRDMDGNRLGFRAAAALLAMPESSLRLRLLEAL